MIKLKFHQPTPKIHQELFPLSAEEGQRYWKKFRNVYKSVKFFQTPVTKAIQSADEVTLQPFRSLSCEFKKHENCQTQAIAQAERDTKEALRYVKREKELFDLIERGENLKKIREILEWDPKKYLYEQQSPQRLANKFNKNGASPLYVAARNGFTEVCQTLIDGGADPNLIVKVNDLEDCALAVAIRWRHAQVIDLLLRSNPSRKCLQLALKYSEGPTKQKLKQILH